MATSFPSGLDALTNPTSSDGLNSPDHAGQHADANDAIEALEAKVGVNGSAVATSLDYKLSNLGTYTSYTPTFASGVTVGNGTWVASYSVVNKIIFWQGTFTLGSTSSITGAVTMNLPSGYTFPSPDNGEIVGTVRMNPAGSVFYGGVREGSTSTVSIFVFNASATYLSGTGLSATVPATWANTNFMSIAFVAQLA